MVDRFAFDGKMNYAVSLELGGKGTDLGGGPSSLVFSTFATCRGFLSFRSDIVNNPAFKHTVLVVDQPFSRFQQIASPETLCLLLGGRKDLAKYLLAFLFIRFTL